MVELTGCRTSRSYSASLCRGTGGLIPMTWPAGGALSVAVTERGQELLRVRARPAGGVGRELGRRVAPGRGLERAHCPSEVGRGRGLFELARSQGLGRNSVTPKRNRFLHRRVEPPTP